MARDANSQHEDDDNDYLRTRERIIAAVHDDIDASI